MVPSDHRADLDLHRFTAVAAHDLREPLATVAGFAQLLHRREADRLTDQGRQMLDAIIGGTERMQALIEDLLAYARAEAAEPRPEPVRLLDAVRRTVELLGATVQARSAEVVVRVPEDAVVVADRQGLETALQNLLSNALKFGGPGGGRPHVDVEAERTPTGWRLAVADDGPGIDPADRERIFAPFERLPATAAAGGTGLGLAIVATVAERSGGELGVDGAPGGGAVFWLTLPAA